MRNFSHLIYLFAVLFLVALPAQAEITASKDSVAHIYQAGIQSFQKGELTKAQDLFLQALEKSPDNKFILYNLGLTDFQLEQRGRAVGAWRRALYIDPDFSLARQAYSFALRKMGPLHSGTSNSWEAFRQDILSWLSLDRGLAVTALFLLIGGVFLIRYWARRRDSILHETPSPPVPYTGFVCAMIFLLAGAITLAKAYDNYFPRATITAKRVDVRSGPSPEDASLFELLEGHEVIINQAVREWAQVTYPGGLTGWVQRDSLFHSSGRKPW